MDVLFFGGMNPQREAIIADVNATGLAVRVLAGGAMLFGEDLDRMLVRTKIVLNLHYYHGVMVRPSAILALSCFLSYYMIPTSCEEWAVHMGICLLVHLAPTTPNAYPPFPNPY